ncbi:glycosyltransferase [Microbacterium oleivorans]|uniref:glycosyltransferase n=1 Tax=Microbacterium oleivorans TaxID=273677 RepID=UPI00203A3B5E|nr:glycosyltransferase [Microbacterium oleivorans]MCM3697158.1 glycosyltransferase [Microbacterium oleivorans]
MTNLPSTIESRWFSWRLALFGAYDVLHFQWPENLLRASGSFKRLAKRAAFAMLLIRLRLGRRPIVVTIHNLAPHETQSRIEEFLLKRIHSAAAAFVALNDTEDLSRWGQTRVVTIPHGDYRQKVSRRSPESAVERRVLFFGSIRSYKNVPSLIHAAAGVDGVEVIVAGKPWNSQIGADIKRAAHQYGNVVLRLDELPESELFPLIATAETVAVPYTSLYNSGVIFLALTIGVPVLAPSTASTRRLRDEVGPQWLSLYDGDLTSADVARALDVARSLRTQRENPGPRLNERDWRRIGQAYEQLYWSVVSDQP